MKEQLNIIPSSLQEKHIFNLAVQLLTSTIQKKYPHINDLITVIVLTTSLISNNQS